MSTDSEHLNQMLEARRRFMRRMRQNQSVSERLARFAELQQAWSALLQSSPDGYQHFIRRNMASRRVEVVDGEWKPVSPDRRALLP